MIEIRFTRPEQNSLIPVNLSGREGYYERAENQKAAIYKALQRFPDETLDVEIKHGRYLGAFKLAYRGTEDECVLQLPHTIPGVSRLEQKLASVEGNVTVHDGVVTLEDGTQHELQGRGRPEPTANWVLVVIDSEGKIVKCFDYFDRTKSEVLDAAVELGVELGETDMHQARTTLDDEGCLFVNEWSVQFCTAQ